MTVAITARILGSMSLIHAHLLTPRLVQPQAVTRP
jgi:hypothetical protein